MQKKIMKFCMYVVLHVFFVINGSSQEVELSGLHIIEELDCSPIEVLMLRIEGCSQDIQQRAMAHFSQRDDLLHGRATLEDAHAIADLYIREVSEHLQTKNGLALNVAEKLAKKKNDAVQEQKQQLE